jgi:hypothetical protein
MIMRYRTLIQPRIRGLKGPILEEFGDGFIHDPGNFIASVGQGIRVTIKIDILGACTYETPTTSSCSAESTLTAIVSNEEGNLTYFWEVISGTVVLNSTSLETITATTTSDVDVTYTLRVTVTDSADSSQASDDITITHNHRDLSALAGRITPQNDARFTPEGDRRVTNG